MLCGKVSECNYCKGERMARKGKEVNDIKLGTEFPLLEIAFIIGVSIVTLGYLLYNQYKKVKGK